MGRSTREFPRTGVSTTARDARERSIGPERGLRNPLRRLGLHLGRPATRLGLGLLAVVALGACESPSSTVTSMLVYNALVVDGTGAAGLTASVRIRGSRIEEVGQLQARRGERVVDATGMVLAPGFIDTHSHHDRGLSDMPEALAVVSQGVTTIVVGQDGGSPFPLGDFFAGLEAAPAAVNVGAYAGHNTLRRRVMGDDFKRPARPGEVAAMRDLLAQELTAGALGLSTGLEYDPGIYSETEEVLELAREAAAVGGRYISHMRSEDRWLWDAVDEVVRIGREAAIPVQISHMKLAMRSLWGRADSLIGVLDEARASGVDVTADVYPYEYWQSTMTVLFPDRDFENRVTAAFALSELAPPEGMLIGQFDPDPSYVGMTLAEIAEERGTDPVTTYLELIAEAVAMEEETGRGAESIIATSMHPDDVARLIAWPHSNVSSDGSLAGRHPRGFGAFPRVFARYVRGEGLLTVEEAVHRMTALSADHVGIRDRGVIRPGAYADLVLFDPAAVQDLATPEDPQRPAAGVLRVWVNGIEVYRDGAVTDARPGRVLVRAGARKS